MNINDNVELVTFQGSKQPSESIESEYNYWKLINCLGVVKEIRSKHPYYPDKGEQALVQFKNSLIEFGLSAHNKIPNSIWIFITDLKIVKL